MKRKVSIDEVLDVLGLEREEHDALITESIKENMMPGWIDWEQRRFELVMAAMQGFIPSRRAGAMNAQDIARLAVDQANAVLTEYRKGGEE